MMQRPCVLLLLLCYMPLCTPADALTLYDPKLCFILDGVLGLYGLFITAMFVREKFFRGKVKSEEPLYTSLHRGQDGGYDGLRFRREPRATGPGFNDSEYTGLNTRREDSEYRELPRREQRQRKNEQVYQGLSAATRDTYDSLHPAH